MAAILLIRSETELDAALRSVNGFLACRRSAGVEDEIVAVCVKSNLDADLAIRESFSLSGMWALCTVDSPRESIMRLLASLPSTKMVLPFSEAELPMGRPVQMR